MARCRITLCIDFDAELLDERRFPNIIEEWAQSELITYKGVTNIDMSVDDVKDEDEEPAEGDSPAVQAAVDEQLQTNPTIEHDSKEHMERMLGIRREASFRRQGKPFGQR